MTNDAKIELKENPLSILVLTISLTILLVTELIKVNRYITTSVVIIISFIVHLVYFNKNRNRKPRIILGNTLFLGSHTADILKVKKFQFRKEEVSMRGQIIESLIIHFKEEGVTSKVSIEDLNISKYTTRKIIRKYFKNNNISELETETIRYISFGNKTN